MQGKGKLTLWKRPKPTANPETNEVDIYYSSDTTPAKLHALKEDGTTVDLEQGGTSGGSAGALVHMGW